MRQQIKAHFSAATTAAGLLFLMWAFFMLPAFGDEDLRFRVRAAAMGICFIVVAVRSGRLNSRLETWTLAVAGTLGIAVFVIGLLAYLV